MIYSICLLLFSFSGAYQQDLEDDVLRSQVERFDVSEGFASTFNLKFVDKYIELVDEQRVTINKLRKDYHNKAKSIVQQASPGPAKKLEQLVKLRELQNDEIKQVLLPEQLNRLESYGLYSDIKVEGFANSLVNKSLMARLDLTDAERLKVNRAVKQASDEYFTAMTNAQKRALAELRDALSREKRIEFDNYLKPLLSDAGTIWKVDLSMFDTTRKRILKGGFSIRPHVSEIGEKDSKEDK